MSKRISLLMGIATLIIAASLAIPAYGQVQVQDLGFQNKAIEPGDATAMDDTTTPATLGAGVTVMRFRITDLDPQADDPSDVTITRLTIDNLGTADSLDIIEVMCMDQDGNAIAPIAIPAAGPNPNITFTAECDATEEPFAPFIIPDGQEETFEIAVRTADTATLFDDDQRNTLVLRVTIQYEETVGSPPTLTTFTAVVTDGAAEFIWNGGLNSFTDDTYIVNPLMPGQQGVVSRFTVCDNDSNENNLVIDAFTIKQGDNGTALFTDIATLKVFRVENNTRTQVGSLTPTAAFDRGGAGDALLLPTSVFLLDDRCTTFEVETQVSPFAFKGKLIQLEFQLSTEEPVATAIDPSVDPEVKTGVPTVIGKGLVSIPDTVILGKAPGRINVNVFGIPLPGLGGLQVGPSGTFNYDPTVIEVKDIVGVGDYVIDAKLIDNRRGQATFTVRINPAAVANALQDGTVAIIQVNGIGNPGRRSRLGVVFDKVTNASNIDITNDVGVDVGEVKIVPPGDIDGDGRTTVADALLLATQLILSTPCSGLTSEQKYIADVATPKAATGTVPTCTGTSPTLTSADVAEIARLALTNPTGSSVGVTALRPVPLAVQSILTAKRAGTLEVQALGSSIAGLQVQVFSLAGQQVISQAAAGNRVALRLQNGFGKPLANGVYLYVVTVTGKSGEVMRSQVRKLVVLR